MRLRPGEGLPVLLLIIADVKALGADAGLRLALWSPARLWLRQETSPCERYQATTEKQADGVLLHALRVPWRNEL